MLFWIIAGGIAVAVAAAFLRALGRGDRADGSGLDIYRDQLAEVERDLARDVIDKPEAERLRVEISRRILAADRADGPKAAQSGRGNRTVAMAMVIAATLLAMGLYKGLGAPGYADLPTSFRVDRAEEMRLARPSQAEAETGAAATIPPAPAPDPAYADLVDKLRKAVRQNPDDAEGWQLLSRNESALGNYKAAAAAAFRMIDVKAGDASAADYATLADAYVIAAGGYVSPEAESALNEALARDATNGTARFYMGLMWAQTGRPDRAFSLWRDLLEEGPEAAPWVPYIRSQIEFLASAAGMDYVAPTQKGPSAADIDAAAEMTAEDRQAMIRGMVEGLAERLASDGGSAEEWSQLITALSQLGETPRAETAWAKAQSVFAGRDDELATINAAAVRAGLVP